MIPSMVMNYCGARLCHNKRMIAIRQMSFLTIGELIVYAIEQ